MAKNKKRPERRALSASSKGEWLAHIRSLGLSSFNEYERWCRQHGFRPAPEKKVRQRQREIHYARSTAAAPPNLLATVTSEHIRALGLESVEDYRAWCLQNGLGEALAKKDEQLKKERAIATLALAKKQQAQTRHLLARYEVPAFMDVVWFKEGAEGSRQQGWFKHVGAGQNIRIADLPIPLSKKQAHHFSFAPAHYTVEEALRYGQVLGSIGNTKAIFRLFWQPGIGS